MSGPAPAGCWGRAQVVGAFSEAAGWFAGVVAQIGPGQWEGPGLGVWTVRELAGHTGRALTTVEEYLLDPSPDAEPGTGLDPEHPVAGAADYFLQVRDNARLHQDVAERGRQAGAALGSVVGATPADDVAALVARVVRLVEGASPSAAFRSRFGVLPFGTYLATRVVELAVHTVDLQRACDQLDEVPGLAGSLAVAVVGELAVRRGSTADVLGALGGRRALPPAFGVFQ